MNAKRMWIVLLVVAALVVSGVVVSAQETSGNGNGTGNSGSMGGQGNGYQGGRNDDAPRGNYGGGLGLAISREIIVLHGGSMNVETRDNRVIFAFVLPSDPVDVKSVTEYTPI